LGFAYGPLDPEATRQLIDHAKPLAHDPCGVAVYRRDRRLILLAIDARGQVRAFAIGSEGKYTADAGPVALRVAEPAARWTTLAMPDAQTLLADADGHVIRFSRQGDDWSEAGRLQSWGPDAADRFGEEIHFATDGDRVEGVLGFCYSAVSPF